MGDELNDKAQAGAWLMGVVAALVFYVLSIGPVAGMFENGTIPKSAGHVLEIIYAPLILLEKTPLQKPLEAYAEWWQRLLK